MRASLFAVDYLELRPGKSADRYAWESEG